MTKFNADYIDYQTKRFMRPDALRYLRPDWRKFWKPGSEDDPLYRYYDSLDRKYRPDQLRDDIGRFAYEGRDKPNRVRLASSDKPTLGRAALAKIAEELAKRAIEAFRSENGLYDLFGRKEGTVSYTELDGKAIYGSNSTSPTYTLSDRRAANEMRETLIQKYPDKFNHENLGRKPNDALYHAEATALLRAARENGGKLNGRELEMSVDREMCNSCRAVLPYVGLELGNPTVTIRGPARTVDTMHNGGWMVSNQ